MKGRWQLTSVILKNASTRLVAHELHIGRMILLVWGWLIGGGRLKTVKKYRYDATVA